jgi:hypothetical protein
LPDIRLVINDQNLRLRHTVLKGVVRKRQNTLMQL